MENESLPLVSVVITNYNYGKYIAQAVCSVMNQTYANIECVIVDDCSTDDSRDVIAKLQAEFPHLRYVANTENGGQSASCLHGFRVTTGAFVIFLDADDYLFPQCVALHVSAQFLLRIAVGVTSVDMVQLFDERMTTATWPGFSDFVRSGKGLEDDVFRSLPPSENSPFAFEPVIGKDALHYVHPVEAKHWPWSPTSGNCFRRDALQLILDNKDLPSLRSCTDIYLLRGVASLTGSALIDVQGAAYRVHGNNAFMRHPSLHRFQSFDPTYLQGRSQVAMRLLLDHLVNNLQELSGRMNSHYHMAEALNTLGGVWPPTRGKRKNTSYFTELLIERRKLFRAVWGDRIYIDVLLFQFAPRWYQERIRAKYRIS